jgi:hypothetical protein
VSTRFENGATKLAYVLLEVRCNTLPVGGFSGPSGPYCSAPTTCVAGRCVSSELPSLAAYTADWAAHPPSACGAGVPEIVQVGQGQSALGPLPEGATLSLERGGQGGHHVWLGVRMKSFSQFGTRTTISATQPGSSVTVPATAYPYAWAPGVDGSCDLVGIRFQVDASGAKAADFAGKPLDIVIELEDEAGHKATSTRRVNIATGITGLPPGGEPNGPIPTPAPGPGPGGRRPAA